MIESIAKLLPDDVWTTTSVAGPEGVVHAVLERLWRAPEFHREIEILSDGSLVGCACDQTIADEAKREATRAFSASRQYSKAIFFDILQLSFDIPQGLQISGSGDALHECTSAHG
jgi:hypothetical protein